jgi:hypothetical protein
LRRLDGVDRKWEQIDHGQKLGNLGLALRAITEVRLE